MPGSRTSATSRPRLPAGSPSSPTPVGRTSRASSSSSCSDRGKACSPTMASSRPSSRTPAAWIPLAAIGIALVALPMIGLLLRAPWSRIGEVLGGEAALTALRLSLVVATAASVLSLVTGFPLAWLLARRPFAGKTLVRALVVMPLVMPPVVAGVGLFAAFGRRGVVGSLLDEWLGLQLTFTTGAAVLAAVLSWARALGEFGATITFAGNLRGRTQTLPLAVFERLQTDPDAAFGLSLLLIAVAFVVILGLRGRFLR